MGKGGEGRNAGNGFPTRAHTSISASKYVRWLCHVVGSSWFCGSISVPSDSLNCSAKKEFFLCDRWYPDSEVIKNLQIKGLYILSKAFVSQDTWDFSFKFNDCNKIQTTRFICVAQIQNLRKHFQNLIPLPLFCSRINLKKMIKIQVLSVSNSRFKQHFVKVSSVNIFASFFSRWEWKNICNK